MDFLDTIIALSRIAEPYSLEIQRAPRFGAAIRLRMIHYGGHREDPRNRVVELTLPIADLRASCTGAERALGLAVERMRKEIDASRKSDA